MHPNSHPLHGLPWLNALLGTVATLLINCGTLPAQQAQPVAVSFKFDSKTIADEYAKPAVVEQDLANKILKIVDKDLRIWTFRVAPTRPQLQFRLVESDALITLYVEVVDPAGLTDPVWTKAFDPDPTRPYDAAEMEKKLLKAVSDQLRYQQDRVKMVELLKDKVPLGGPPVTPLLLPQESGVVLPLLFKDPRSFELAKCEFRIECADENQVPISLRCLGLGKSFEFRSGDFLGIRILPTYWDDQAILPGDIGNKLARLKATRRFYLSKYVANYDPGPEDGLPSPALAP